MGKRILLPALLLIFLGAGLVPAQDKQPQDPLTLRDKHQVGIRLGVWANNGATVPPYVATDDDNIILETDINDASFYFEGFFAYNIMPHLYAELSFGMVNRGSVTLYEYGTTDVGNLLLYPILLQLKFYPLASFNARLQPYLTGGGGIYYGRRDVQFTDSWYYYGFDRDSETDFNYTLGAGADWLLTNRLALDLNLRYMAIDFSEGLIAVSDYNALTVTVGIKYLVGKNN